MLRTRPIRVLSLSLLALAGALGSTHPALSQTAKSLKCNKCVDSRDLDRKAINKKKIRPGAVDGSRLRDHAVTPGKWGLRAFDANDRVLGPLGFSGEVLLRASGGPRSGTWFAVSVRRNGLVGDIVVYSGVNCTGQAFRSAGDNLSRLHSPAPAAPMLEPAHATNRIGGLMTRAVLQPFSPDGFAEPGLFMKASIVFLGPLRLEALSASVGPDPALGADPATGEPVRLVALLPANPGAPPQVNVQFLSQASDLTTGGVRCFNMFNLAPRAEPLIVIDDPDLSTFTPPFRAGLK